MSACLRELTIYQLSYSLTNGLGCRHLQVASFFACCVHPGPKAIVANFLGPNGHNGILVSFMTTIQLSKQPWEAGARRERLPSEGGCLVSSGCVSEHKDRPA